jgi:dolichol-phosphate mannosyltransferase
MSKLISFVVPMYNESENVDSVLEEITKISREIIARWGFSIELIINDNASTDDTFEKLRAVQARSQDFPFAVRVFRFSRNIGFQRSILVGYKKARGDAVIQVDADLQDPPSLTVDFIEKWLEGYYVVYGVRCKRQEGMALTALRKTFYRLLDRISADDLPHDSGDFRLIDRRLVAIVCEIHDQDPYLRGLIASLGTRQTGVPYDRAARKKGESKFGMRELVRLSLDAVSNHSVVPLRIASYLAFAVTLLVGGLVIVYLGAWLTQGEALPAGFIGVQGEYIARIHKQVKEYPLAIIEQQLESCPGSRADTYHNDVEVVWFGEDRQSMQKSGGTQ